MKCSIITIIKVFYHSFLSLYFVILLNSYGAEGNDYVPCINKDHILRPSSGLQFLWDNIVSALTLKVCHTVLYTRDWRMLQKTSIIEGSSNATKIA